MPQGATIPSFDVVRVEKSGDAVMAGRAEPFWTVKILSNDKAIATTKADDDGDWTVVPDKPLLPGTDTITLLEVSPDGKTSLTSQQSVLVALGGGSGNQGAVVALSEPGKATRVLQERGAGASGAGSSQASSESHMAAASGGPSAQPQKKEEKTEEKMASAETGAASSAGAGSTPPASSTASSKPSAEAAPPVASRVAEEGAGGSSSKAKSTSKSASKSKPASKSAAAGPAEASGSYETQQTIERPAAKKQGGATSPSSSNTVVAKAGEQGEQAPPPPQLQVRTVDYEDHGANSGEIFVTGVTEPNGHIKIYLGDKLLGETEADALGNWQFKAAARLGEGTQHLRAELVQVDGTVIARATVGMQRMNAQELAAAEAKKKAQAKAQEEAQAKESQASSGAGETETANASPPSQPEASPKGPTFYTVRRGDTLWAIAEQYYGGGWRYTWIFRANRGKIRNPNLIYPEQKFSIKPKP